MRLNNKLAVTMTILLLLATIGTFGCRGEPEEAAEIQIATVERGDLVVTVTADGNLVMPREVELKFGTPGTVKKVYVEEGQKVKAGALLAKLDDTAQQLAVKSAQYNLELALNELVEKILPALMGYPGLYPDTSAVLRVEQAREELRKAQQLLEQNQYLEAATELRLAQHDLEASYKIFNVPQIQTSLYSPEEFLGTLVAPVENYPDVSRAIERLEQDIDSLAEILRLLEEGDYQAAQTELTAAQDKLQQTHQLVNSLSGRIRVSQRIGECCWQLMTQKPDTSPGLMALSYPDTSTALAWLRQVEQSLQEIQACKESDSCDALEMSTLLRMAQHDVDTSQNILANNELIFRSGVNLKALRAYNLNIQLAENELENAKEELMKTEILAPFDGTVVNVGVKENDQLSAFDYSAKTAIHLVDTSTVKMDGMVDEIDIFKIREGQETIITIDAMPEEEFSGKVTFISPFGTQLAGVVEFPITIALDPSDIELKGGLTATADIIVAKHENVLLVPNQAIKGSPGDYWVEVVIDEETMATEKRAVELGAQNEEFSEVLSGLSEGEKVLID